MEYLIPLLIFAALAGAIHWYTKPRVADPVAEGERRAKLRRWAFIVLGAVVLLWLLSALGVCGRIEGVTPRDPLLNR